MESSEIDPTVARREIILKDHENFEKALYVAKSTADTEPERRVFTRSMLAREAGALVLLSYFQGDISCVSQFILSNRCSILSSLHTGLRLTPYYPLTIDDLA